MFTNKTLLVTGVSPNGISIEICKRILEVQKIARKPVSWTILLAQRDPQSTEAQTAYQILQGLSETKVYSYACDLSNFDNVRRACHQIRDAHSTLDVVILNAGVVSNTYRTTIDGNELSHQVNHLGHFLMLHLFKDMLRDRVIFVGSSLHKKADAVQTFATLNDGRDNYSGLKRYAQSKLLSAYCLSHWDQVFRQTGVNVVLVSPGFVPSTNLSRDNTCLARLGMSWFIHYLPFARTRAQAGDTLAAIATVDDYRSTSNVYLNEILKEVKMHDDVYDTAGRSDEVWQWSALRTGILTE